MLKYLRIYKLLIIGINFSVYIYIRLKKIFDKYFGKEMHVQMYNVQVYFAMNMISYFDTIVPNANVCI